ncbi:ribosome biogenesis protein TSR3 isoform X1 [Aphis craccivora]|uniref:Ribosome biogenesis protein TSR3 isoform X1 n=1 Tax=Aphis craccivora TaxID=307492 RepID=A0A6G0Z4L5_APHCR|nr:ribosome biogenesis protein TSR3 isoform X1 [Aphis craccivora]
MHQGSFNVKINDKLSTRHRVLASVPRVNDIAPFLYIFYTAYTLYLPQTPTLSLPVNNLTHLNTLMSWFNKCEIKINETK